MPSSKKTNATKVIAFEGIDGSGKGKQVNEIKVALENLGYRVDVKDFPVYSSFFGKEIGYLLSGDHKENANTVEPKSMSLWYALDRAKAFRHFQKEEYDFVLLNRSTLSNAVYQSIRVNEESREAFINWVFELEYQELGVLEPDLYLVFDISESISAQNVTKKKKRDYLLNTHDVYERSEGYMSLVRKQYHILAEKMPSIHIIDCLYQNDRMKSVEEITKMALDLII